MAGLARLLPALAAALLTTAVAADDRPVRETAAAACATVERRLASVHPSDCNATAFTDTGASSVEGRTLFQARLPARAGCAPPRGRVLVVGGIHGDELASVSIVFWWLRWLGQEDLAGHFEWNVVPALNPDGLLRRDARRTNANGVDLNRNFPFPQWQRRALREYWVGRTGRSARRYPGPGALSEPESRWLAREIERFRPDAIVSVHAPHGLVDFDGPPHGPERLGRLHLDPMGTYPGSLGNYAGVQQRIPIVTVELPHAGIMPSKAEGRRMWRDLLQWLEGAIPKKTPPVYASVDRWLLELERETAVD